MPHSNISIFIPHMGCKNNCSFCNQNVISSTEIPPTAQDVTDILHSACENLSDPQNTEIAFFGGTFTALELSYMTELLEAAQPFITKYKLLGIRISTRPDCIHEDILLYLKMYNVTAIEIGAQSMCDHVLFANKRGHLPIDVKNSAELIKEHGFELGIQMMTGLYQSELEDEIDTANRIIALAPDTVRIYPIVVLKGTRLEQLYLSGLYKLPKFDEMVSLCADLLELFKFYDIKVIRLGLHASTDMESQIVAGYYHPAFREICESILFRRRIEQEIIGDNSYVVYVNPRDLSKALGQKKSNIAYFNEMGKNIKIISDNFISENEILIKKTVDKCI